ncbi:MAG: hypothetical protein H0W42_11160, partial [Gemmatimonadaceae bacterium]|nr:hypothetical protein [Gemmatimonadaceae bacterium]
VRGEPGIARRQLLDDAIALAAKNDERAGEMIAQQIVPRRLGGYQMQQRRLAPAFGTPEDSEVIGVKRA